MSNWIKLSDGEPNRDEPVLVLMCDGNHYVATSRAVVSPNKIEYCHWEVGSARPRQYAYFDYSEVAYWQPLPDAPEADDD
jgi:hypothetical protein